jgi:HSP20 family protein
MYRRYSIPSVWREMDRLQREMNRLVDDPFAARYRPAPAYPAMNVWTSEEGLQITAEVPGVNPKDIDISVVGSTLTLTGIREQEDLKEGSRYHRQERGYGNFTRSLQLPLSVNVDKVEANFKNGILNIVLPRAEEDKPKKIAIKSA